MIEPLRMNNDFLVYDIWVERIFRRIRYCLKDDVIGFKEERLKVLCKNICRYWYDITKVWDDEDREKYLNLQPEKFYMRYQHKNKKQFVMELAEGIEIEFFCHTEESLTLHIIEELIDNSTINYIEPSLILSCLKPRYMTTNILEIHHQHPDNKNPLYNCDSCPVCLEEFDPTNNCEATPKNRRNTFCGHPVCYDCFNSIARSNKKECPMCRVDYEEKDIRCVKTQRPTTIDDIITLQQNYFDVETIYRRVDIYDLATKIIENEEHIEMLEFEFENWDDGKFIFAVIKY
jgi:hypothetical protein